MFPSGYFALPYFFGQYFSPETRLFVWRKSGVDIRVPRTFRTVRARYSEGYVSVPSSMRCIHVDVSVSLIRVPRTFRTTS